LSILTTSICVNSIARSIYESGYGGMGFGGHGGIGFGGMDYGGAWPVIKNK
jgi:hypothetical protein